MAYPHEIQNTEMSDLVQVYKMFEQSIRYQEKRGYPVWRDYDKNAIIRDIENRNQYKVLIDSLMAMVFSVAYADKIIWRHWDQQDSIYLHRIVVNPDFKGRRVFGFVLDWAAERARSLGLKNVRMDTWAANPTIIDYYRSFGFTIIENYTTPDSPELPVHNRKLALTLLEYKLDQ